LTDQLPKVFGPANAHHVFREMVQQLVNVASDPRTVFRKIDAGHTRITTVTGMFLWQLNQDSPNF
jgi:hypothetical protein